MCQTTSLKNAPLILNSRELPRREKTLSNAIWHSISNYHSKEEISICNMNRFWPYIYFYASMGYVDVLIVKAVKSTNHDKAFIKTSHWDLGEINGSAKHQAIWLFRLSVLMALHKNRNYIQYEMLSTSCYAHQVTSMIKWYATSLTRIQRRLTFLTCGNLNYRVIQHLKQYSYRHHTTCIPCVLCCSER